MAAKKKAKQMNKKDRVPAAANAVPPVPAGKKRSKKVSKKRGKGGAY